MSATVQQIMDDALTIMGEVAGTGVQAYTEDRVFRDAIRSFNLLFKKYHWKQYQMWQHLALDGTTGIITTDALEGVKDFEDFISINPDGKDTGLPTLPTGINPFSLTSGTEPLYWTSLHATHDHYRKRKLQIYPVGSVGYVDVCAMVYPVTSNENDWDFDSEMHLDRDMLSYGTAFMTLAADDLNPQGAGIAQQMMEMRFRDIMNSMGGHKIPLGRHRTIPTNWSVAQ